MQLPKDAEQRIAGLLGLSASGDVVLAEICEAARIYCVARDAPYPRDSVVRGQFQKVLNLTNQLSEALDELDPTDQILIGAGEARAALVDLHTNAAEALDATPLDIGGSMPNEALRAFVMRLGRIYMDARGQRPTHTWNPYSEFFSSDFDQIVFEVMKHVDADVGESSIDGAIRIVVRFYRKDRHDPAF